LADKYWPWLAPPTLRGSADILHEPKTGVCPENEDTADAGGTGLTDDCVQVEP
jgi:hypothetical protein